MDRPQVSRLLSELALRYQPLDSETSDLLGGEILVQVAELTAVPVIARLSTQMTHEHTAAITQAMIEAGSGRGIELAAITEGFARDCAHWDVSVGAILRTYQRGQQRLWLLWKERIEQCVADPEARAAVLALCAEILLEYVTAGMELTVEVHAAEREIRLRGASWQRRDDVLAVLEDRATESEADLSYRLKYSLRGRHVAFVCWSDAEQASRTGVEEAARAWAEAAAGRSPLLIPVDGTTTWGWIAATDSDWLADPPAPAPGFRVAVGTAASGVPGFRRSHTESLRAQAIAAAGAKPAAITRFAELATLAVLTDDRDALRRFVADQLGGLAGPGEREERLRTTVRSYLEGGANVRAVARDLNYHRNTIQQRLDLAAALRGRPLEDDRSGLALALTVAAHYGAVVLTPDGPTPA